MAASSKMVESIDWSKVVHTLAIGATIAGLGYLAVHYYRSVLLGYFEDCETLRIEGVQKIL